MVRDKWVRFFTYVTFAGMGGGGLYACATSADPVRWLYGAIGVAGLVIGAGLWFERGWARYAAVAVLGLVALGRAARAVKEPGWKRWGSVVVGIYFVHLVWHEWRRRRAFGGGIQVLSRRLRRLTTAELADAAKRAWSLPTPEAAEVQALGGDSGLPGVQPFLLQSPHGPVSVLVGDSPFGGDEVLAATVAEVPELRLRTALAEHRGWFSIDAPLEVDESDYARMERCVGSLAAALLDADSVAIFNDDRGFALVTDLTATVLAAQPALAFTLASQPPVLAAAADDNTMAAAIAKARASFPEFEAGFHARRVGADFFVKAPFTDRGHTEHLWVKVTAIAADTISGTVENDPVKLGKPQLGQVVRVAKSELSDWLVRAPSGQLGGFTVDALAPRAERA